MYEHREAFCLMMYATKDGRIEWLWNSRDGVTPFIIWHPDDGAEAAHADWFRDVRAPFHVPPVGSRVFVDLTEARARARAQARIESMLDHADHAAHLREHHQSPEAAVEALAKDMLKPGAPDILVVNKAMQDEFRARVPVIPSSPRAG